MGIREDGIKAAIQNMDGNAFEHFAFRILYEELYPGLNPTSETYDFGEDARTEWTTLFQHHSKWVSVSASKTATLDKLKKDCKTAKDKGRHIDIIVFATSGKVRRDVEEEWRKEIKNEFGWDLEVRAINYFAPIAAADRHASLVDDYLQIPPPGGDFLQNIEAEFDRLTAQALSKAVVRIVGLVEPLARTELSFVEDQWKAGKQVLLTGEGGTGKSGIGVLLARAAQAEGRSVLLIDARRIGDVKSENAFRRHFNLNGPVESAVARVARKKGCRIILDQFDNAVRASSIEYLTNLALACLQIENTETIVISRKIEYHEETSLKTLLDAGFVELTSHPITEIRAAGVLEEIGIENARPDLVETCRNLLNLSLVATIKDKQPTYDFSNTLNEVELWEGFIEAMITEESVGVQTDFGDHVVEQAVRLAREGLRRDDRSVILERPRQQAQRRLVSWQVIIPEEDDIHHFRHEQMQDFLVAKGAVMNGTLPSEILNEFDKHRSRGVFAWMDKLYARRPNSARRGKFLKELFTLNEVPFYALAEVLQQYISAPDPAADTLALPIILDALRTEKGLRSYFLRSRPHPQWASILWAKGFFKDTPSPQPFGDHHVLPPWDEQNYLISVATDTPVLLVEHLKHLQSGSGYVEQGVRALCLIRGEHAELAVPRVLEWLLDYSLGQTLASAVVGLIKHFIAERRPAAALNLFRGLMKPHPSPHFQEISGYVMSGEAVPLFSSNGGFAHQELPVLVRLLAEHDPKEVVTILEEHLIDAIRIEVRTRRLSHEYVWDSWNDPLSESRGFGRDEYKNILLRMLRQTLEDWADKDANGVRPVIETYLNLSRSVLEYRFILRRLAVHLLQKDPARYRDLVRNELLDPENLNTLDPKDEFLMLMQKGHQHLTNEELQALIERISRGLPPEIKARFGNQTEQGSTAEPDPHFQHYEKKLIRDQLAALRDCLTETHARLLSELIEEVGEPISPGTSQALHRSSYVGEVSPITKEHLALMSPDTLVNFARDWQPETDEDGRALTSYEVLANMLAEEILLNPTKYGEAINKFALIRHSFASALITRLTNPERYPLSWEGRIALCESLLADEIVRTDVSEHIHGGWTWVRLSVVRLIATWVDKRLLPAPKEYLPPDYFTRVRDILLSLCNDPDPAQDDTERNDELRDKEVSLIAHGRVRPSALSTLILYAVYKARLERRSADNEPLEVSISSRLEPPVREILTRKLDREADASWAMHSVYGEHLYRLHWLDRQWVEANLKRIFPESDGERLRWYFVAAWDSFIRHNGWELFLGKSGEVNLNLFDKMRRKYARAIENLSAGRATRSSPQPARDLAAHLLIDYLYTDYDLRSEAGQQNLIAQFYRRLPPLARADAAWVLWHICSERRENLDIYWRRALALWAWRVGEASGADHQVDYDDEMNWFALLLHLAAKRETLSSLWPLLEGMLPHIARPGRRNTGWDDVEEYLAKTVERDPMQAIKFYHMMLIEYKESLWMFYPREEGHRIVQVALASPEAKQEALEMINFLARHRNYHFRVYLT